MHKIQSNPIQSNPIQSMRWVVVLISGLLFFSCTKDETNASQTNPTEKLAYVIPEGYPRDVLDEKALADRISFAAVRLKSVAATTQTATTPTFYSLDEALKSQVANAAVFPNLDAMTTVEFEKLKKYFPTITPESYPANEQTIRDYFQSLIAFKMTLDISKMMITNDKPTISDKPIALKSAINFRGIKISYPELKFLLAHNRMIAGVIYAYRQTNDAYNIGQFSYPGGIQDSKIPYKTGDIRYSFQTPNDALRHAMLTALIAKYGGQHYGSVDKAVRLAIEFTDLHEIDANYDDVELSHNMDKNNNRVGAEYFRSVGYTVVVESYLWGAIKNRDVRGPDDLVMLDALFNKGFKKGLFYDYLTLYFNPNILVYLRTPYEPVLEKETDWPVGVLKPGVKPPLKPEPTKPEPPIIKPCKFCFI